MEENQLQRIKSKTTGRGPIEAGLTQDWKGCQQGQGARRWSSGTRAANTRKPNERGSKRARKRDKPGGAKAPLKPVKGVVPYDREDQGTASGDNDGEVMKHYGEPRFGALGVPRAQPKAFFKNVNNLLVAHIALD